MNDQEVNKIIAEFMGYRLRGFANDGGVELDMPPMRGIFFRKPYTKSLDALVPVWEKLKNPRFIGEINCFTIVNANNEGIGRSSQKETLYQAAAHATAKAILELKK